MASHGAAFASISRFVSCSCDNFVLNQTFKFSFNFDFKSPKRIIKHQKTILWFLEPSFSEMWVRLAVKRWRFELNFDRKFSAFLCRIVDIFSYLLVSTSFKSMASSDDSKSIISSSSIPFAKSNDAWVFRSRRPYPGPILCTRAPRRLFSLPNSPPFSASRIWPHSRHQQTVGSFVTLQKKQRRKIPRREFPRPLNSKTLAATTLTDQTSPWSLTNR